MRILILDTYYENFLSHWYRQNPQASSLPYDQQWRALQDQCFGTADFYSSNLMLLGHEAAEIVINCEPLQRQWAAEQSLSLDNGLRSKLERGVRRILRRTANEKWFYQVLAAQIKEFRPDVLYIQDMNSLHGQFLREMKPHTGIIAGQIASPMDPGIQFQQYDLVLSSLPHFVDRLRRQGVASEYFKLGFDPRILKHLNSGQRYGAVFVGTLSNLHRGRIKFLERLASAGLDVWGSGAEMVDQNSPLHARHHGEAWATDMYQILRSAAIVINHHLDLAESFANNMRLYEATGVGSLLLTDWKQNLDQIFAVGGEVVAYRCEEEALELMIYYLEHEAERQQLGAAGQRRTLQEHTYYHRMAELIDILEQRI